MTNWRESFERPGSEYGACPFWFWNGELDPDELLRQVDLMHAQGISGFVIHPRVGLTVEYLSETWFERCRLVIDEAARRGMKVWIYDEENWPSGYAGGRVVQRDASFRGQNLTVERHFVEGPGRVTVELARPEEVRAVVAVSVTRATPRPPEPLHLFQKPRSGDWRDTSSFVYEYGRGCPVQVGPESDRVDWDARSGKWCLVVFRQQPTDWMACYSEHPYVDLMNSGAVGAFVEETHERYYGLFREHFGDTILGFFIDEPALYNNFWDRNPDSVPFTHDFASEFAQRRGYDFFAWAAALWIDLGPRTERVRVDYWRTVAELMEERCFRQIADWCGERGVALTGHLEWEEWLYTMVRHCGSPFHALRPFQVPAVDKIDEVTDKISEKLVASIAHAQGRERVLSETFALIGWKLAPPYMKRIVDQQYVRGINWLSCHGFYYSTEDWRKYECPPSEFFQNPWWEHSRPLWDYVARLSAALSSGHHRAPVALYYPVEHAWATMTPSDPPACDGGVWELWQLPRGDHPTQRADASMQRTAQRLLAGQYDFDMVDHALVGNADVVDGSLCVGNESFQALVVPACDVIDSRVLANAITFAEAGGTVVFMHELPQRGVDDALPEPWTAIRATLKVRQRPFALPVGTGWIGFVPHGEQGVLMILRQCVPADVEIVPTSATRVRREQTQDRIHVRGTAFPTRDEALRYHCRAVDDGDLYFIRNESDESFEATLRLRGGPNVVEHDVLTGERTLLLSEAAGDDRRAAHLHWSPWQSRLLHVGHATSTPAASEEVVAEYPLAHWHLTLNGQRQSGPLESWHELGEAGLSGIGMYEARLDLDEVPIDARIRVDLGAVFETARLWVNGRLIGDRAWPPYVFDVTEWMQPGVNRLRVAVANSNTNAYEQVERVSGLLGPAVLRVAVARPANA